MSICLLLPDAFGNTLSMTQQFKGQITSGKTTVPIGYSNFGTDPWRFEQGVQMLDQALSDFAAEDVTVFGDSMGARIINQWLYELGDSSSRDPLKTKFVNMGDSGNKFTGLYKDSLAEVPNDTPYNLTTIIRQYDGYADYPSDVTNDDATTEAWYGTTYIHRDYYSIDPDPDAPGNYKYIQGNVTYVWNQTYVLPSVDPVSPTLRMLGFVSNSPAIPQPEIQAEDVAKRPLVEAGYTRPVSIPAPDYS